MISYLCLVVLMALLVKFIWTVLEKWTVLEWLQGHAPNQFIFKLLSCEFCRSFWTAIIISIPLCILFGSWIFILIPIFSCNIR